MTQAQRRYWPELWQSRILSPAKVHAGRVLHSSALNETDMYYPIKHSLRSRKNILWHVRLVPAQGACLPATIRDQEGAALPPFAPCGRLEVA